MNKINSTGRDPDRAAVKLLEDIFATRPDEIQCDQAELEIAQCAAERYNDEEARKRHPALFYHFRFCPDCADYYAEVMDFAQKEAAGLVKRPMYMPPPPISVTASPPSIISGPEGGKEPGILDKAADAFRELVERLTPPRPALVTRDRKLSETPDTVEMEGGEVAVTLTLKSEQNNPNIRRLICNVETTNDEMEAAFESAQIWLAQEPDGELVQEQMLNQFGDVTFTSIPPGVYALHLDLVEQHFIISGLEVR